MFFNRVDTPLEWGPSGFVHTKRNPLFTVGMISIRIGRSFLRAGTSERDGINGPFCFGHKTSEAERDPIYVTINTVDRFVFRDAAEDTSVLVILRKLGKKGFVLLYLSIHANRFFKRAAPGCNGIESRCFCRRKIGYEWCVRMNTF